MVEFKTMVEFQTILMYAILVIGLVIGIIIVFRDYGYPAVVNLLHTIGPNWPWRV